MTDPALQGVGVGASLDSPGDPALILYVLKDNKLRNPIPPAIDGLRTRVKETTGFRAGVPRRGGTFVCRKWSALRPAALPARK